MKVVAFNGSPRKRGNTHALLSEVLGAIEAAGIATELRQVGGEPIRGCRACYLCKERKNQRCAVEDDIVNDCIAAMIAADGVVLGSPTYFSDLSSEMKALIDRAGMVARTGENFLRRKAGAAVVSVRRAGAIHAFDSMNHFFTISEMVIPGSSYWNIGVGHAIGDAARDEEGMATMRTLGQNMAWLLKKIRA